MDRIRTSDTRLTALHRRSAAVLIGALLLAGASLASCTARSAKPDLGAGMGVSLSTQYEKMR